MMVSQTSKYRSNILTVGGLFCALALSPAGAAAESKVIGQFLSQGSVTLGTGAASMKVVDTVNAYFSGDQISVPADATGVVRLNDDQGVISLSSETDASILREGSHYKVVADGQGLRFLFAEGTPFRIEMDCYVIQPAASEGLKKVSEDSRWIGGAVMRVDGGAYVQGVRGNLNVTTGGEGSLQRVAQGDQYRGCDKAGAMMKTATATAPAKGDLAGWAIGAVVGAVAIVGGGSSGTSSADSSDNGGIDADSATTVSSASSGTTESTRVASTSTTPSVSTTSTPSAPASVSGTGTPAIAVATPTAPTSPTKPTTPAVVVPTTPVAPTKVTTPAVVAPTTPTKVTTPAVVAPTTSTKVTSPAVVAPTVPGKVATPVVVPTTPKEPTGSPTSGTKSG